MKKNFGCYASFYIVIPSQIVIVYIGGKELGHDISGGLATGYQITNNKNIGPTARALRRLKAVGETEYRAARVTSALNESRKIFGQIVNFYGRQYVQETFSRGRTEDLVASNF